MPTLEEVKRPAFYTAALDLAGKVEIQQIQYRMVLDRDGKPDRELELLPIELLHVANPTPQDTIADTLAAVLGDLSGPLAARVAELEAQLAAVTEERDRLRIVVSAFPETSSGDTASAADSGDTPPQEVPIEPNPAA